MLIVKYFIYLLSAKVKAKFIVIVVLLQNIHAIIEIIIVCFLSFGDKFRNLQSYISWFGIKILENYTNLFVKYSKTCLGCCLNRSKLHNIKKILYMQSINSINSKKKQWFFNTCISSFLTIFWILQLRVWLVYISALEKFLKLLNCVILIWKKVKSISNLWNALLTLIILLIFCLVFIITGSCSKSDFSFEFTCRWRHRSITYLTNDYCYDDNITCYSKRISSSGKWFWEFYIRNKLLNCLK